MVVSKYVSNLASVCFEEIWAVVLARWTHHCLSIRRLRFNSLGYTEFGDESNCKAKMAKRQFDILSWFRESFIRKHNEYFSFLTVQV